VFLKNEKRIKLKKNAEKIDRNKKKKNHETSSPKKIFGQGLQRKVLPCQAFST
jgi:hypothetical protein